MSITAPLSLMSRWFRRPRGTVREQEPADLGTAFGLECWLDEEPQAVPAVSATRAAGADTGLPHWLYSVGRD